MAVIGFISVEPGEVPECPACKSLDWQVKQRIDRESRLVRVDKFSDLVVELPDPDTYLQSIVLACKKCKVAYQPQAGIFGKVEAYSEGTQTVSDNNEMKDLLVVEEKITGHEDGFGFPGQVQNLAEWEA